MYRFSGERLKSARVRNHIRPEQMAVSVERSTSTILNYEAGRVDPPASMVADLATFLDIPPGELFAEGE